MSDDDALFNQFSSLNNDLVTAQRESARLAAELAKERDFLRAVLAATPEMIYIYDLQGERFLYANRELSAFLGYSPCESDMAIQADSPGSPHPEDVSAMRAFRKRLAKAKDGEALEFEYRARWHDGTWIWVRGRETPLKRDAKGTIIQCLGAAEDISKEKAHETKLQELALEDGLTGLRNRRGFYLLAEQQLRYAKRGKRASALLFLDLDDFKGINDRYGHEEGDFALKAAAELLRRVFRESDVLARLGGDEFAILMADAEATTAGDLIGRLRKAAQTQAASVGRAFELRFSIGLALSPRGEEDLDTLLRRADAAMYADKSERKRG